MRKLFFATLTATSLLLTLSMSAAASVIPPCCF
jgi:hypothetical protein